MLMGVIKGFGVVLTQELVVLAKLKGQCKIFPPFKRGDVRSFTLSDGWD